MSNPIFRQPIGTLEEFLHRHDRFKPTRANLLLLGFAAGIAVTVITFVLCAYLTK